MLKNFYAGLAKLVLPRAIYDFFLNEKKLLFGGGGRAACLPRLAPFRKKENFKLKLN